MKTSTRGVSALSPSVRRLRYPRSSPRCCRSFERALGAEHPGTLTARANLAYCTGAAGDAAGARGQFASLLPVRGGCWALSTGKPD